MRRVEPADVRIFADDFPSRNGIGESLQFVRPKRLHVELRGEQLSRLCADHDAVGIGKSL
jgi:hypothetical protein